MSSPTHEVGYSNLPVTPTLFPTGPVTNVQEHSPVVSKPPQAMSPELLYGQDYLQFMQQQQQQQYMQVSQQKPQLYGHSQTPNHGWQCPDVKRLMHPGDGMGRCILY